MLKGADVSAYQSLTVPAGDFVIIKATEGVTYTSSTLAAQLADARKKGMLVGFYHFGHPKNDAVAEAEHFYAVVRSRLKDGDIVVLDHEVSDGTSAAHCASWARAWLQHVELRTGKRPVVYTYLSFAREGRCAGLGGYPLWIAHYTAAGKPSVPAPWRDWALHQWTDKPYDQNVLNGGREAWPAGTIPTPTPEEDEMIARDVKDGLGAKTGFPFPAGKFTTVTLFSDNTYTDGAQVKATQPVMLRIVLHRTDGTWQTEHKSVGRGDKDLKTVTVPVKFTDAKNTDAISVTRESGDGTEPIGFCIA